MPELPDLTVFADNLQAQVAGRRVAETRCSAGAHTNVPAAQLSGALADSAVISVERSGKELCFRFDNGRILFIHLMLTGGFRLLPKAATPPGFSRLALIFQDGSALLVEDPKNMVTFKLDPQREQEAPDALSVDAALLRNLIARKPRTLVKGLLIDQKVLRGIGNAYADEILWQARISPKSVAGRLPPEAVEALAAAIPTVLNDAISQLRERHGTMISGEFREFLAVHNRARTSSPTGHPIRIETVASKKTYFTDEQRLYV